MGGVEADRNVDIKVWVSCTLWIISPPPPKQYEYDYEAETEFGAARKHNQYRQPMNMIMSASQK